MKQIDVMVDYASHIRVYVDKIFDTIREAAKVRGTGIRNTANIATKMKEGKTITSFKEINLQVSPT